MKRNNALNVRDIPVIALMSAILSVSKFILSGIPNIEITSFLVIVFSLCLGNRIYFTLPVFILTEGLLYGFNIWWIMYLYAWPLLVCVTKLFKRIDSAFVWGLVSGAFGLSFGFLCSIPYIFLGSFDGGITNGLRVAFLWWVAGIPWDIVHFAGNFIIMTVLYKPVVSALRNISDKYLR